MVEAINKSLNITVQTQSSEIKEKKTIEPQDNIDILCEGKTVSVKFSPEKIESVKKHMEKEGFVFNLDGFAPSIIYSEGVDYALSEVEEGVILSGGKVTGSLWILNAIKADITPSVYAYITEHMTGFSPCPDREFRSLIKPLPFCIPDEELINNDD